MFSFKGKWITNKDFYKANFIKTPNQDNNSKELQNQHILFRDYFDIASNEKVYLYYAADDFAAVFVNGHFV